MNKIRLFIPIVSLLLLAECGKKSNSEKNEPDNNPANPDNSIDVTSENGDHELNNFSYTLDTLPVDVGDDFIYLNSNLLTSDVSHDGKYLYNFDKARHSLQIIDLENMELGKSISLELEGPNGIGSHEITNLFIASEGKIFLSDHYQASVIDQQGNKSLGLRYDDHDFEGSKLPEGMKIDFTNKNEVNFYNLRTESLSKKTFKSNYTSQEAAGNYANRTETEGEFWVALHTHYNEVRYGPFFFDDQNEVYWRFSTEMNGIKDRVIQFKTVLTAFDPEFNQLHEELLPSEFLLPPKYFIRDGLIYSALISKEELTFGRLKPTFDND